MTLICRRKLKGNVNFTKVSEKVPCGSERNGCSFVVFVAKTYVMESKPSLTTAKLLDFIQARLP